MKSFHIRNQPPIPLEAWNKITVASVKVETFQEEW